MDDAPAAIAALAPNEIYELVHEVGFEDAQPLIELATPEQIRGCFDLEAWNKDDLQVAELKPWIGALIEAGFEKVGEVWAHLDAIPVKVVSGGAVRHTLDLILRSARWARLE